MLFTKVSVVLAIVASAFAEPIENIERDTESADYSTLVYSIGKRDVEKREDASADYSTLVYSIGKKEMENREVESADYSILVYSIGKRDGEDKA
ncbi:hypothetical protein F4810DRAFT_243635 [Camillea tinctor]|nr:hypothetical protein F4810DRAFT_243635 [Camillea tinctor]